MNTETTMKRQNTKGVAKKKGATAGRKKSGASQKAKKALKSTEAVEEPVHTGIVASADDRRAQITPGCDPIFLSSVLT